MNADRMAWNWLAAAPAASLAAIFGGWDILTKALAGMMIADYLSGLIAAAIQGNVDSRVGWKGALRKVMMLLVIVAASLADYAANLSAHPLRAAACLYYIGNEGISLIENLDKAGVPIPRRIAEWFAQMHDKNP